MNAECSMETVPPGYKQTEVGVIPEDWNTSPCSALSDLITVGIVIRPTQYYAKQGVPALRSANIREKGIDNADMVFISEKANTLLSKSQVRTGDVLTVRTGYPGTSAVVPPSFSGSNCIDILITRPSKAVSPTFLSAWINSPFGKSQVFRNQGGLAQQHFNVSDLKNLVVGLPPTKAEQESIAEALSDTDALIESLEQLIAKKRQIKQGAMQELLTGKRRLPRFEIKKGYKQTEVGVIPEDWEVKQLGDIATIATGNTPPTRDPTNYGDEFMFVSPFDLGFSKYIFHTEKMLSKKGFSISRPFPAGSVLFVCIGSTIGKCGIASEILTSNQQINAILPSEEISYDYLYYSVSSVASKIKSLAGEQAVPIVNKTQFSETTIATPSTKSEQEAISSIFSYMDSEITALEEKLAKARQIKQGMMQELLTGRIRLI